MSERLWMKPHTYFNLSDFEHALVHAYEDLCSEQNKPFDNEAIVLVEAWIDFAFKEIKNGALRSFFPDLDYTPWDKSEKNHFESSLGILLQRIIEANKLEPKFIEVQSSW